MKFIKYRKKNGQYIIMDSFTRDCFIINKDNSIEDLNKHIKSQKNYCSDLNKYLKYVNNIDWINTAYYNITYKCNLNCTYCYSNKDKECVSLKTNKKILQELINLNCKSLVLIGGEPFCHRNFYKILKESLKLRFKEITIVTNGTILSEQLLKILSNERISLQISLDGYSEETNAPTRG